VRVGLNLPQYEIDFAGRPERAVESARAAEDAGLDAVWLSDHPFAVAPDGSVSGALDAVVTMGHIAANTSRIVVGSLVLACSMRSTEQISSAARELALVAPERAVLGLGAGWFAPEHRAFGAHLGTFKERLRALEETVDAVRESRVEVLIGGTGEHVLDLAARSADWWNCSWDVPVEVFRRLGQSLDAASARADRDPSSVRRSVGVTVLLAASREEAQRAVDGVARRASFLRALDLSELERAIVVGDADVCARRIAEYGADEVVITPFERDDIDGIKRLGGELVPLLR